MANSLRVIYNNLVDLTTTTVSANVAAVSGTSTDNLKNDFKSKVYRAASSSVTFTVSFGSSRQIGGVILPFCNLTPSATITVSALSVTSQLAAPYSNSSNWSLINTSTNISMYSYGGGTYARAWGSTQPSVSSLTITITDSTAFSTYGYLEFGRLVVGPYWSPTYNTSFGLQSSITDLSKNERTESGDLISIRGPKFASINFDLKYMDSTDRSNLLNILKVNGLSKPLFISLFPNDTDAQREGQYQIYGKLGQLSPISYPFLDIYSSQVELEEV